MFLLLMCTCMFCGVRIQGKTHNWLLTLRAYSPQQLDGKQVKWKYSYQVTVYCIFIFLKQANYKITSWTADKQMYFSIL